MSEASGFWLAVAGLLVNGGGLVFLGLQVRLAAGQARGARNAQLRELDRIREAATIAAFNETFEFRRNLQAILPDDFQGYAVGVSSGVLDLEVTDSLMGSRLVSIARNYRPFIEFRRKQVARGNGTYAELEWLASELVALGNYESDYVPLANRPWRTAIASTKLRVRSR